MDDDPAGLSGCVGPGGAPAIRAMRTTPGVERPAASLFSPRRLAVKPPSRGRRGITPQSRKRVKVISPGYPVVFAPLRVHPWRSHCPLFRYRAV